MPEWLPEDATLFADLTTADHYYADGDEVDPSVMFGDTPTGWGFVFNRDETGLNTLTDPIAIIGPLLEAAIGGDVIVIEYSRSGTGARNVIYLTNLPDDNQGILLHHEYEELTFNSMRLTGLTGLAEVLDVAVIGLNRVAFRITAGTMYVAVNGSTAATLVGDTPDLGLINTGIFGLYGAPSAITLLKVEGYPSTASLTDLTEL